MPFHSWLISIYGRAEHVLKKFLPWILVHSDPNYWPHGKYVITKCKHADIIQNKKYTNSSFFFICFFSPLLAYLLVPFVFSYTIPVLFPSPFVLIYPFDFHPFPYRLKLPYISSISYPPRPIRTYLRPIWLWLNTACCNSLIPTIYRLAFPITTAWFRGPRFIVLSCRRLSQPLRTPHFHLFLAILILSDHFKNILMYFNTFLLLWPVIFYFNLV